MNLKNYLKKSISTGLGKSSGSAVVSLIFIPLIIRNIGLEDYGIWMLLAIFMGIAAVADVGLSKTLVYFIPKQEQKEDINEFYSAGLLLNGFMICLVIMGGFLINLLGINVWGKAGTLSPDLSGKIFMCGIIVAICSLATVFCRSILEAFYKIYFVNIGFLLQTTLNYIAVYLLSFYTNNVVHFIYLTTFLYILMYVIHVGLVTLKTSVSFCWPKLITIKNIIRYASGVFSIGILSSIIQPLNRYLIVFISGDVKIYGIFDVALRIAQLGASFLQAFAVPLFSVFSGYGREKIHDIKQLLNIYLWGAGSIYILGCIAFLLAGKPLINLFVQKESIELFQVSLILIGGVGLLSLSEPFFKALFAIRELKIAFKIRVWQPVSNIILIILLAELAPLYRFAIAYACAAGFVALAYILLFRIKNFNTSEPLSPKFQYEQPS